MNTSTEVQTASDLLLSQIRTWESELDEMSAENGQVVLNATSLEDKKLVDHFENQILIQKHRLDQMKHEVKLTGNLSDPDDLADFSKLFEKLQDAFVAFSEPLR